MLIQIEAQTADRRLERERYASECQYARRRRDKARRELGPRSGTERSDEAIYRGQTVRLDQSICP